MTDSNQEDPPDDSGDSFTDDTDVRVKGLGSVMSFIIIVSFIGLLYLDALGKAEVSFKTGLGMTLITLVLAAGGWTFGMDLLKDKLGK